MLFEIVNLVIWLLVAGGLTFSGVWMLRKGRDDFQRAIGLAVVTIGLAVGVQAVVTILVVPWYHYFPFFG